MFHVQNVRIITICLHTNMVCESSFWREEKHSLFLNALFPNLHRDLVEHDAWPVRRRDFFKSIFSSTRARNQTLEKTKLPFSKTVPVCRMEKIISDMSKHQQLIKRLILFVPLGGEISLKLTFYRNEHLFAFFSGCVGFGFGFWIFPFSERQPL